MNWLDRLGRKWGNKGIKGLMTYIIGLNVVVFILMYLDTTHTFAGKLELVPQLVLQGEVWRLVTFIFLPPTSSPLFLVFVLYLYYLFGSSLEHEWGTFRFNVYYFIGVIATIAGSLLTGSPATSAFLNLSLLLASGFLFPNFELLIFFILPVKIKYLAMLDAAYLIYTLIVGTAPARVMVIVSLLNFLLFFWKDLYTLVRSRGKAYYRKGVYQVKLPRDMTVHRCEVCGRTEKDDRSLEFRYCSKCEGDHEYCMEHLESHEHRTG